MTVTFSTGFVVVNRFGEMVTSNRPVDTEALARIEKGKALDPLNAAYKWLSNQLIEQ